MSKVLKGVGKIAGAVAAVAFVVGVVTGNPALIAISQIAAVVSTAANTGAALLQKKPPARGSITQVTVGSDPPQPCILGESYYGGILRHDTGYGATLKKVPNPYRWMVIAYSGCGPLEELVAPQIDFAAIGGYYAGFLSTDTQLGATPEATALVPPLSAPAPGWGAASKLSGQAAIGWNFKFDKEGKVFASGLPVLGAVWKGVKVYDPRLDSTYPGGAGAHRIANEATWAWSDNPALHALAYAYGRRQNSVQVFGVGLPVEAIRVADFVTLANVCDANVWRLSGVIFEPGDRWANLKEILRAGGAEPISAGGLLSLRVRQPQVALATIADKHLLGTAKVTPMQTYVDRLNTVVPKYRSPVHNWELVAADRVQVATYLAEDGEEMIEEIEWGLVRDVNQVTQLARYRLEDGREYPVELTVGPEFRAFRPGECLHLSIAALGVETDAVILTRRIDPGTLEVTFGFASETAGKHAFALGMTGTPPPTPALGQTSEERDLLAAAAAETPGVSFFDPAPFEVQANSAGATTTDLAGGAVKRTILVYKGGELQTAGVTVGAEVESPDAAIDSTVAVVAGAVGVTLDKADASGSVVVPVTFEGATYARTIVVKRTMAAPVSGGGGGADPFIDSTWTNISTTGDVQVTDTGAQILSNASGELQWSFISSYTGIGSAVIGPEYSTDGSTWFDFAAEVAGSAASSGEPGFVMADGLKTGLTASTVYYIRLIARRSGGSGTLSWSDPNFTVNQP